MHLQSCHIAGLWQHDGTALPFRLMCRWGVALPRDEPRPTFDCRDCDEYKRWKASQEAGASGAEGAVADLTLKDKAGGEIEKQLPGGKVKKKAKPQVRLKHD